MYELANQPKIKYLPAFIIPSCLNMMRFHIESAYKNGVNIGEFGCNSFIYQNDDLICQVEYIKMACNISNIFKDIYNELLYNLRLEGYIDNSIYPFINFHKVMNEVNNTFNSFIEDEYIFEEVTIYSSEISIETSIEMYDTFTNCIINELSSYINPNLLKYVFNKFNITNIQIIQDKIMTQIANIFTVFY